MNDASKRIASLSPEEKRALLAQLLREKAQEAKEPQDRSALSHDQKALWFLYRLAPESAAYNLLYAARVRSTLDVAALGRAVQALIHRYPILTATYGMQENEPIQRFHPEQAVNVELIEAAGWSEEYLRQQLEEEGNRPFNLEQGPILRVKLFARSHQDYILALTVHHIAVDFWSLDILVEELYALYAADSLGLPSPLAAPGPQYSEYVRKQNEMLAGPEGQRLRAYWLEELAGDLPVTHLPTDRPRPPVQSYRGASHSFTLSEELSRRLRTLANGEQVTLFMLLLAAFQTLLFRYSHQEDLITGTPALGRNRSELEKVVGYLANPVALRANFAGNPSFKDLLAQVRRIVLGALEHQDYPFPLLVEQLQPKRDPSYSPIFQTLFIWDKMRIASEPVQSAQNGHNGKNGQHLSLEPFAYGQQGAPFDLTLTIFEHEHFLAADFRYNTDLFEASTLARMAEHFQTLLNGIVEQPTQRVQDLPLLSEAEREQILLKWNATQSPYPEHATLHQLIEEQVQRTPEAPAVIFEGTILSYRELNSRANRLAHTLQAMGIGPDTLVGVCMERSLEMVVALVGILKAGGAYVPLDPAYPQERLSYMLQDAQVPVLLTQTHIARELPEIAAKQLCLDEDWQNWQVPASTQEENPCSSVGPENLVYMIYTSGSTGKPKGVMNTHRGICNRLYWMQQTYKLTAEDRVLQKTPFSFDVSAWEFFWPLLSGAALVVARPGGQQDPAYLASIIAEEHITTLHFVPSMLQAFLLEPELAERGKSLKRVICSGEALPFDLQERFFASLDAELHNLYGPTEAAIDVTYWACQRGSRDLIVPIGRPIANTQIYILDQSQNPVPVGVAGELYIGGVGVARGYFNRPELTAEKFVRDPFSQDPQARLFRTGDLARYRADGAIEFLGRIDHQVKIRGFRIELGEIEAVLAQHPTLKEVVVMAREDTPGNKRLVAYLVPSGQTRATGKQSDSTPVQLNPQEAGLSIEALRDFLKDKLPYYMVPAAFLFLDSFPLQPNGKVNRKALPAPDTSRPELENAFVAPQTPTEQQLARIWAEVLGIEKVGIHDNFFDLGGASIQSLEIISKVNETGLPLELEMLFEFQTIAELAAAIEQKSSAPLMPSAQTQVEPEPAPPASQEAPQPVNVMQPTLANTVIESLGVYLPPKIVSTDEIVKNCVKPIRFPLARLTGIKNRRMAGETEFSIDLAKKAIADCLAKSKYNPEDIDLLICGNISRCNGPNQRFEFEPSTSVQLKRYFGFTNAIVFDLDNACTGLFTAIDIIDAFLKAGLIRRGLAVSGEYITHLIDTAQKELEGFMDSRMACLTVGDAGAAVILEKAPDQKIGFHDFELFTLGHYSRDCIGKATDREHGGAIMYTDAVRVSAVNMKYAVAHAAQIIQRTGWPTSEFQHIIIHQTSNTTIRDAAREINSYYGQEVCTQDNVINNIAERANTATTTQMVALGDHIRSGRINSGDNVVFGITGSGATIGAAIYTFDDLPERIRRVEAGEYKPEKVAHDPAWQRPLLPSQQRIRVESVGTIPAGAEVKKEVLTLAQAAAEAALTNSEHAREDIDLLMYAGVYRDELICEPALAAIIEGDLGINDAIELPTEKKTFAFDIFNGSLGLLNACYAAIGMLKANKANRALLVTAEIENNRDIIPEELLGLEETGSALILDESPDGKTGFGNFVFKYFTDYIEAFDAHSELRKGKMTMRFETDSRLQDYYLQCIEETVKELLSVEQLDMSQIKVVLPQQISSDFTSRLGDILKVDKEKLVDLHPEHDLYTSSLPYVLQHVREQQIARPGDIGLIISVGSGIQVGCATYYF
ncbi:amino acid adenylation domain-containing protein [Ktedonosporobacter rubrisoli]|uniref:Amino acid adenylation domain-containing protein n=1 Tax=Ktedonosporobacter rubrisoli TaxID=2509675 RepID=A0A4P6JU05_KTERU|nr:non-ribosomal peptide synthetase [Ktedonosporobacter rubrisoli]QBD78790.1 amino acid adenylation domain-containing protein [Ktedonosporobacter rubrisoli]